jgi:hypothetical protein
MKGNDVMPQGEFQLARAVNMAARMLFLTLFASTTLLAVVLPQFDDYKVPLYKGTIHTPKWIHRGDSGEARDKLGKLVEEPEINFGGKYFLAVHSCGTGCRYYTLTDLSSGRDLNTMDDFATGDPAPKTRDGHDYLTELFSHPDSRMLIAQYHVELGPENKECRERAFLFEEGKLKPITNTRRACRKV